MLVPPRFCVAIATLALSLAGQDDPSDELVPNGAADDRAGWFAFPVGEIPGLRMAHDAEVGATAPGSLLIECTDAEQRAVLAWTVTVELSQDTARRPSRLVLSAALRAEGFADGTQAQLMAQLIPEDGSPVAYPRADWIEADTDWRATRVVFEVPAGVTKVRLLAWQRGVGSTWFDDLSLRPTDEEPTVTAPPGASGLVPKTAARLEQLARGASSDLGWVFDSDSARELTQTDQRPILVYLRCTDWRDGLDGMRSSLAAPGVPLSDDGFAKDVLFRAGPLSDPEVAALIDAHFVPVCLTYLLAESRPPLDVPPAWGRSGMDQSVFLTAPVDVGAANPGCLAIDNEVAGDTRPHSWAQGIEWNGEAATLRLAAQVRAQGLSSTSEACVMVQCWKGSDALGYGRLTEVRSETDWTALEGSFEVPEGTERIRLLAYLVGVGLVHFDDLEISFGAGERNLLVNGSLDRLEPEPARIGGFALDPAELTTPALAVLSPDGEPIAKLHRIGVLSGDFVRSWLTSALERFEPTIRPVSYEGWDGREAIRAQLSAGDWSAALVSIERRIEGEGEDEEVPEEARFWRGWCLWRLARFDEARATWEPIVGETRFGRKAAACLLPRGPRLYEAASLRSSAALEAAFADELPPETEGLAPGFDAQRSLRALLELQRSDGSFGSHQGLEGYGWNDAAITALSVDAIRRLNSESSACERALAWLADYAGDASRARQSTGAFNNPYALETLLREGELESAAELVAHVVATQNDDGNWSVYGAERPASFNTALNVMALLAARDAGLEVPAEALERGLDALDAMRQAGGLFPYSTKPGHEWMTTEHGSIARDALCEHALLRGGRGSRASLEDALERYWRHAWELRQPTKRLYDYFNARGHGGYYFFFAHRNAVEAALEYASRDVARRTVELARTEVIAAQEGDGTFMDKYLLGRAYGTAQALLVMLER